MEQCLHQDRAKLGWNSWSSKHANQHRMANQLSGWSGHKWMEAHRIERLGQPGHLVNGTWLNILYKAKPPSKPWARFSSPAALHAYPFFHLLLSFESFLFAFRHVQVHRKFVIPGMMCARLGKPCSGARKGCDSVRILQNSLPHLDLFSLLSPLGPTSWVPPQPSTLTFPHRHFKSLQTYWLSCQDWTWKTLSWDLLSLKSNDVKC